MDSVNSSSSNSQIDPKAKKVALFGGSFDPIHEGHITIAKEAVKALALNQVRFIPCKQSPHKLDRVLAEEHHRLKMLQLATTNFPWAIIDDHELNAPPPSYSWKTVEHIKQRFPNAQLFWLMGTDQWDALPRWSKPEFLAENLQFIVYSRASIPEPRDGFIMHHIHGDHPASSTDIRNGDAPDQWLHPKVSAYIREEQLYQNAK